MSRSQKIWFDVILHPHRSLSARGFLILMASVSCISFTAGLAFFLMGAWPVFGFFGLDVLAIYWAFKVNYRSGEVFETIQLTGDDLVVRRYTPKRDEAEWRFQAYWVRVLIEQFNEFQGDLILTSHGRRLIVGAFLTLDEKLELAKALENALSAQRRGVVPETEVLA